MFKKIKIKFTFADIIAIIICILVSAFLWLYVSSTDVSVSSKTFNNISVDMSTYNKSNLNIISGADTTIDVVLTGKKTVINKITKDDISAYVIIGENATASEKYECTVYIDPINNVTITPSVSSVYVYLGRNIATTVPVTVSVSNYILDDGYELDTNNITTDYSSIRISGPEDIVSKITEARLDAQVGHVTKKIKYSGDIEFIDDMGSVISSKYISADVKTVSAVIPVYKIREVPVEVSFVNGIFDASNCNVTISPSSIKIKGDPELVDAEKIVFEIDEKTIVENQTKKNISFSLSNGIENMSGVSSAEVTIVTTGIKTKSVTVDIQVRYNPNNYSYKISSSSVLVKIRGPEFIISEISKENIYAYLDLSNCVLGSNKVPVSFTFLSRFNGKVYEIGEYHVSVDVEE